MIMRLCAQVSAILTLHTSGKRVLLSTIPHCLLQWISTTRTWIGTPCPPDRRGSTTTTSVARSAARVTRPTKGTVNPFGPLFLGNTARAARFTPNFPSSTPNALVYSWSLTTRKIPTKSQRFFCTCTSSEEEFICQKIGERLISSRCGSSLQPRPPPHSGCCWE